MRNPNLKLVNKVKESDLLKNILAWFQRSKIKFKNEDQLLQSIGIANIRIGMAQAHMFLVEHTKTHRELKHYLSLGVNHRILLDCLWVMQARGDENIIIGNESEVDSLTYAMKKMTGIGIDATKKIILDGVKFNIFKRVQDPKDRRSYTYEINDSQDLIEAYIEWGNTNIGITGNLFMHILQGAWNAETQTTFFRKLGFMDNFSNRLTRDQEVAINKYWGRGAIFEPRED
jgi:hypothetical protein